MPPSLTDQIFQEQYGGKKGTPVSQEVLPISPGTSGAVVVAPAGGAVVSLDANNNAILQGRSSVGAAVDTIGFTSAGVAKVSTGASGSFTSGDLVPKTVTVVNGIITSIV